MHRIPILILFFKHTESVLGKSLFQKNKYNHNELLQKMYVE